MNIGVAAHITAAASGGPRFDLLLTSEQRSGSSNGIWLCQVCAAHIDRDETLYTTQLLHGWKIAAEAYAKSLLTTPELPQRPNEPILDLPFSDPAVAWLPFSARVSRFVGRDHELGALHTFLDDASKCMWWLVTGPAGSGKSRLALELCISSRPQWRAGFLSRGDIPVDWRRFRPEQPTLVVVDYVATRSAETSAMILQLSRSIAHFPYPIRVLLLERDEGSWLSRLRRDDSHTEAEEVAAIQFAPFLRLGALASEDLSSIAEDVARHRGYQISGGPLAARIRSIDPLGRPLFGMIAADIATQSNGDSAGTLGVLERILRRERARWNQSIQDSDLRLRFENLVALATMLGGILPRDDSFAFLSSTAISGLLSDPDTLDINEYSSLVGASAESLLPGLQPDLLGERLVLDSVRTSGGRRILSAAASLQPDHLCAFIVRTFQDFPADPGIETLIDAIPYDSVDNRVRWGSLIADLVLAAGRSDEKRTQQLLCRLRSLAHAHADERLFVDSLARSELYLGNVFLMRENNYQHALLQYNKVLTIASPNTELAAAAINNRGIVYKNLKSEEQAYADWNAVAEMSDATDEARACALNNRADVHAQRGDHDAAIRDRSAVLALADTSYNRRYIALIRRSASFVTQGRIDEALLDLDSILRTTDISDQQKATAMVNRALLLLDLKRLGEARHDLEVVLETDIVFPGTHDEALVALAEISRLEGDASRSMDYLIAAVSSQQIDDETLMGALTIYARLYEDAGDLSKASVVWRQIASDPRSSDRQRAIAEDRVGAEVIPSEAPAPQS